MEHRRLTIGFFAMIVGMFMAILDIQIVASSISQIQAGVSASAEEIAWVQTSYLIAEVIGMPLSGLLSRALGMRRLFIYSAAGFTMASALCAAAWDLPSLIVFRCIQGFLGAAMIPTTMAAAFGLFGPNRSLLQQVSIGLVATLAPSIGPTLGGYVTEFSGWRWLFLINLGPGIISCWLVAKFIPGAGRDLSILKRMDLIGLIAMALFLGSFEWVFEKGPAAGWLQDDALVRWMLVCLVAGAVFFGRSFAHREPIVNLRVFADRNIGVGAMMVTIIGLGLYGSAYLMPLFLGQVRGLSALQIGWIMSVGGMAMFVGGPIAGILIRRIDPRYVVAAGIALTAVGLYWNHFLTAESGYAELFWPQATRGFGIILAMAPLNFLSLGTLTPSQLPNASALITVCRNLGGAIGLAYLNTQRLHFGNLHQQDLSAGLDPSRPEVQAFLARAEADLRSAGEAEPARQALGLLVRRMQIEADVMTFGNLFFAMAVAFAFVLLLMPFIQKPTVLAGGAPTRQRQPAVTAPQPSHGQGSDGR